jgi:hypothetical protein
MKVETDVITSIAADLIRQAVIQVIMSILTITKLLLFYIISNDIITCITACLIRSAAILVMTSVSTFITVIILYYQ